MTTIQRDDLKDNWQVEAGRIWMLLYVMPCEDPFYSPHLCISYVSTCVPPRERLGGMTLWAGQGEFNVEIKDEPLSQYQSEGAEFVGEGVITERIPCNYVAPYERIADPDSPIVCCVGTVVTADQEDVVDCPKCKRRGTLPNPKWPYKDG